MHRDMKTMMVNGGVLRYSVTTGAYYRNTADCLWYIEPFVISKMSSFSVCVSLKRFIGRIKQISARYRDVGFKGNNTTSFNFMRLKLFGRRPPNALRKLKHKSLANLLFDVLA